MITYIKKYSGIIFLFVILALSGSIVEPLAIVIMAIAMFRWMMVKKENHLLMILLMVLVMGDSRAYYFAFFKNLRIVAILLLSFYTITLIMQGKIKFRPLLLLSLPFFFIAFFGSFRSPQPALSFAKMISYFLLIFLVLHYIPYLIRKRKGEILLDIVRQSSLFLLFGLIGVFLFSNLVFFGGRFRGVLGNPNGLGQYCTFIFMLVFVISPLFPKNKGILRFTLLLILASLLLSGSRTALGTIGIFYLMYFFYKRGTLAATALWIFILPILYISISLTGIEGILQMLGLGDFLRIDTLISGSGRFLAWQIGINEIYQAPFIGRGFAYEELFFHSMKDFFIATEHQGGMHNSYLTFIMNNGFIGFLFFIIFLIAFFRKIKSKAYGAPFIIASLISATFESWLNSSLNAFNIHFFIVLTTLIEYPSLKIHRKAL